jgi:hypothetical protein
MPCFLIGVEFGEPDFEEIQVTADCIEDACVLALAAMVREDRPRVVEVHEIQHAATPFYDGIPHEVPPRFK